MRRTAVTVLFAIGALGLAGCETSGPSGPDTPGVGPAASVRLAVDSVAFTWIGQNVRLAATVLDQRGAALRSDSLAWRTADSTVARVDTLGVITARGTGSTVVIVSRSSLSDTAAVRVVQLPDTIAVAVSAGALNALGATTKATARVLDRGRVPVEGAKVSWSIADSSVAVVDSTGSVRAKKVGRTRVVASLAALSGQADVEVTQVPARLTLARDSLRLTYLGETDSLRAAVVDSGGSVIPQPAVRWSSSDASIVPVDSLGVVRARANGTVRISAVAGPVSAQAVVVMRQAATTLTVTPSGRVLAALTDTVQMVADARDRGGSPIVAPEVAWSTSDGGVATVDARGIATAVKNGRATITAASGPARGDAILDVAQVVVKLEVAPDTVRFSYFDQSQALVARPLDRKGYLVPTATIRWESSAAAIAQVDAAGLVRPLADGTARLTARVGDLAASSTVVTTDPGPRLQAAWDTTSLYLPPGTRRSVAVNLAAGNVLRTLDRKNVSGNVTTTTRILDPGGAELSTQTRDLAPSNYPDRVTGEAIAASSGRYVIDVRNEARSAVPVQLGIFTAVRPKAAISIGDTVRWIVTNGDALPIGGSAAGKVQLAVENLSGHSFLSARLDAASLNPPPSVPLRLSATPPFVPSPPATRQISFGGDLIWSYPVRFVVLPFDSAPEGVSAVLPLGQIVREKLHVLFDSDEYTLQAPPGQCVEVHLQATAGTAPTERADLFIDAEQEGSSNGREGTPFEIGSRYEAVGPSGSVKVRVDGLGATEYSLRANLYSTGPEWAPRDLAVGDSVLEYSARLGQRCPQVTEDTDEFILHVPLALTNVVPRQSSYNLALPVWIHADGTREPIRLWRTLPAGDYRIALAPNENSWQAFAVKALNIGPESVPDTARFNVPTETVEPLTWNDMDEYKLRAVRGDTVRVSLISAVPGEDDVFIVELIDVDGVQTYPPMRTWRHFGSWTEAWSTSYVLKSDSPHVVRITAESGMVPGSGYKLFIEKLKR